VTISGINIEPDPNYGFYYHSSISSDTWGTGDAGKITVTAENLGVLDGAIIVSYANLGGGDAGNIGINSENILVSGVNETIYNQALQDGKTIKFALDNARSTISSETLAFGGSGGDAGNISLTGENIAVIDGAWIQARATSDTLTATNSGDILIITSQLSLENGGSINSTIESAGNAGDIQIKSHSTNIIGTASEVDKTGIFSSTGEYSTGPGGDISIESALLTVEGGAEINAETSGAGRSGDINMIGTKLIVTGSNPATGARSKISAANASTESSIAAGDGGNINIESEEIEVNNSGLIFSGSTGTGASGNINIKKANKIYITNNGEISTMTLQADGGNITLESDSLLYQVDGTINTSVNGSMGDGGNIEISTNIYVLNNGQVIANAHEGSGGNISISANRLILDSNSIIDASSHLGIDGQVNIDLSGDNDINPEKLPDTKDDVAYKFTTLCSPYNSELSSLSVVDSLPANLSIGEFSASEYGSNMIFLNTKLAKPSASAVSFTTSERMQNFIRNSIALTNCD
jgi:large exoprotein involved in heme utilization and adhesion